MLLKGPVAGIMGGKVDRGSEVADFKAHFASVAEVFQLDRFAATR